MSEAPPPVPPGPWQELDGITIGDVDGKTIARVYGTHGMIGTRQLVAEAPAMLAVLKGLLDRKPVAADVVRAIVERAERR